MARSSSAPTLVVRVRASVAGTRGDSLATGAKFEGDNAVAIILAYVIVLIGASTRRPEISLPLKKCGLTKAVAVVKERFDDGSHKEPQGAQPWRDDHSVSFYGLGIYAILEAMLLHEEGVVPNVSQLALPASPVLPLVHVLSSPIW